MALLEILHYPDNRLREPSRAVETVDEPIRQLADDMAETMYASQGVGLAAPQVDRLVRLITLDVSESRDDLHVLINPEITAASGEQEGEEGCLSVPGVFEPVTRAATIQVRYLNRDGHQQEAELTGYAARAVQHELDHLDGKLFVDYLSRLKRNRVRKKLEKRDRQAV